MDILRPEWMRDGRWRTLEFADDQQGGVEVVDFVEPVLRKVDLWAEGEGAARATDGWSITPDPDCLITTAFRTTLVLGRAQR